MEDLTNKEIENWWIRLEDSLFEKDEDGDYFLNGDWFVFEDGTHKDDVLNWFDRNYDKGLMHLMYEL